MQQNNNVLKEKKAQDKIDKLAWIYIKEGKLLNTKSKGKSAYLLPGGKREGEETDIQALTREVKEELSVDLVPNTIKYMGVFEAQAYGKPVGTMVRITCYTADFIGEMKPNLEVEGFAWLTYADKSKTTATSFLIFDWLKERGLLR